MEITAQTIKDLRERTGAGVMDCKRALAETGGDFEKAIEWLRQKGMATAVRKAGRVASEGIVEAYIHHGGRIGVLVEVNCETDFVARTEEFRTFAREIAMQVAAARPLYLRREDVPGEVLEGEKEIYRAQARNEGKPEPVLERIVQGRLEKFYKEVCLLEQPYIRDPEKSIKDILAELIAKVGENIEIRRFARFEVGEEVGKGSGCST